MPHGVLLTDVIPVVSTTLVIAAAAAVALEEQSSARIYVRHAASGSGMMNIHLSN